MKKCIINIGEYMKNISSKKQYRVLSISKSYNIPEKELLELISKGVLICTGGIGQYKYVTGESLANLLEKRKEQPKQEEVEEKNDLGFDFFHYKRNKRKLIKNIEKRCERRRRNGIR